MTSDNDISPRELELAIFDVLSSGCTTYSELRTDLIETFSDRIDPDNKIPRLSDESLYKSLSLLRKNKLIQSAKYFDRIERRSFTLYANTDNSVEVLLGEAAYQPDHVRSPYLPGRYSFWHDRDLTKVTKTIKRDAPEYMYHYGFEDEFALRRSAKKSRKGDLYPDLKLYIKIRRGDEYFFRIEVQRNRQRIDQFAEKLRDTRNNLVLCKDRRLIHDVAETHVYVEERALFALIDDFTKNGLFKTQWLTTRLQVVGFQYYK